MTAYFYLIILICLSATFAYINYRWIKLPFVIGLFLLSTVLSIGVLIVGNQLHLPMDIVKDGLEKLHIEDIILNILLGFLLFAGSLHTDWQKVKGQLRAISILAVIGVIVSTIIIACLVYFTAGLLHLNISFLYCLLFGALISPTDPIAVLGILTKAGVPEKTEVTIIGESLFNDGIGVVLFIALLEMVRTGTNSFEFGNFFWLFMQEAVGGILIGLLFGYFLHLLLRSVDHYETEILLTLAFVMGGYAFFNFLHISGALAMVVMGLMVGNFRQKEAMSDTTQEYVNKFWKLTDVILNAILFILIAFVLLVIDFQWNYVLLGIITIFIVLLTRFIVVFLPAALIPSYININFRDAAIIWWGGLRGGLSLALVLSLPPSETKEILLLITYIVVVFSIMIQGLSVDKAVHYFSNRKAKKEKLA